MSVGGGEWIRKATALQVCYAPKLGSTQPCILWTQLGIFHKSVGIVCRLTRWSLGRVEIKGDHIIGFLGTHQLDLMEELGYCRPALVDYFSLQVTVRDSLARFEEIYILLDNLQDTTLLMPTKYNLKNKLTVGGKSGMTCQPPFSLVPASGMSRVNLSSSNSTE